ncbi:trypsin-like peptidase domain-containing protein [Candidatus Paracaedibacter symbiosus]|uniref:trypsin-like peptidase domain-containing protein n=1 Tax=Candidatus Paracaedibacter symbiosus TaxID=244582 RepID=UPI00068AC0BE|nr:trypsin-like peptidase domain-containing protein [Candidatus Paracaedibacter symbiosus]
MRQNVVKYFMLGVLATTIVGYGVAEEKQSFLGKLIHKDSEKNTSQTSSKQVPEKREQISFSFAPVVNKAKPAVVSIYALQVTERRLQNPLFDEEFFNLFLGNRRGFGDIPRQQVERSLGSGVIIDSEGIIITCHHVIRNAKAIQVKLDDNRTFEAEIVVNDVKNDLAVIKINPAGNHVGKDKLSLPFIPLGDTKNLEVGDLVIAIGNPFGIGLTVTNGIISALSRNFNDQILLQTDAPINPGNSGGALVDMKGNLIAIPNAILSKTGASHGVGFAIPSAVIRPLLMAAKGDGKVIYPWDGIKLKSMSAEEAESFGFDRPSGVLVVSCHPQSPALKAGLKAGDIITKINGHPIQIEEDYKVMLQSITIGNPIQLTITRKGKEEAINFSLIAPPASPDPTVQLVAEAGPFAGVKVANMSPALALEYNLAELNRAGVVVVETPVNGFGFGFIGVQPGDIIEEVNGQKITTVKQLISLMKKPVRHMGIRRGDSVIMIQAQ